MLKQLVMAVTALLVLFAHASVAQTDIDQIPPDNAKQIYQVIDYLEEKGVKQVLNIQFDDWIWKASAMQGNKKTVFYMSPANLVIFKQKKEYELDPMPPNGGKTIRDIFEVVEDIGYRNIRQITFENLVWKVKTYNKNGQEKKFIIEPISGAILYKNAQNRRTKPYDIYGLAKN